jgi:hypothetical protein
MPTTTVRTITIKPGERFTLPPGATVIYTSNSDSLESVCDIDAAADMQCYVFDVPIQGADIDDNPLDFYITGFKFDDTVITLENIGSGLALSVASNSSESASGYVNRLAQNLWAQLATKPDNIIMGLTVAYVDYSSGDHVGVVIRIPKVFKNVIMTMIDTNTKSIQDAAPARIASIGREEECGKNYIIGGSDAQATRGTMS